MNKITVIAVASRQKSWTRSIEQAYVNRLRNWKTEVIIVKSATGVNAKATEAKRIIKHIPKDSRIFVLDEKANQITSKQFAKKINSIIAKTAVVFIIGGAFGIDDSLKKLADFKLSLSSFTLPHELARLVLLEQCYRAWSIIHNHPYHKE